MKKVIISILCIGGMCVACQGPYADLRKETARVVGTYSPDQISVSDVERGPTRIEWKAQTPKSAYKCTADEKLRRVKCVN